MNWSEYPSIFISSLVEGECFGLQKVTLREGSRMDHTESLAVLVLKTGNFLQAYISF